MTFIISFLMNKGFYYVSQPGKSASLISRM